MKTTAATHLSAGAAATAPENPREKTELPHLKLGARINNYSNNLVGVANFDYSTEAATVLSSPSSNRSGAYSSHIDIQASPSVSHRCVL